MRRDVLLLAAICCSLLDRCVAARMRCARRATRRPPSPKSARLGAAQRCSPQYVEIDGAIPHRQRRSPQGNSCFAITTPPAARMAHLRTMARRRFGSSRPTASNSNAATRITIDTYRLANIGSGWRAIMSGAYLARRSFANYVEIDRPIFAGRWAVTQAEGAVLGFRSGDDYPTEGTSMEEG